MVGTHLQVNPEDHHGHIHCPENPKSQKGDCVINI
jgi:hypothetical protein